MGCGRPSVGGGSFGGGGMRVFWCDAGIPRCRPVSMVGSVVAGILAGFIVFMSPFIPSETVTTIGIGR